MKTIAGFDTEAWLEYGDGGPQPQPHSHCASLDKWSAELDSMPSFKRIGEDVTIREWTRFARPENITIGSHVIIDDFVLISGGRDCLTEIGSYIHIACFSSLLGSGGITLEDFTNIAPGCRLFSESDDYTEGALTGPTIPAEFHIQTVGRITLKKFAILGANTVVLPGVTIGEGAVVGACGLVVRDLAPWTVNVGIPTRVLKWRNRDEVLRRVAELEAR